MGSSGHVSERVRGGLEVDTSGSKMHWDAVPFSLPAMPSASPWTYASKRADIGPRRPVGH